MQRLIKKTKFKRFHVNKHDLFSNVMSNINFRAAKDGLQAVRLMFDQMFPLVEQVTMDNEILLEDADKQMKQYAELDEKYKNLVQEYDKLLEKLSEKPTKKATTGKGIPNCS